MKIAVVTCNIGNYDNIEPLPEQSVDYTYICFTEKNLPFPLANLDRRMKARYLKCQMHRYLPQTALIWIDGRIKVTSSKFVEYMVDLLLKTDIVLPLHPERNNIMDEYSYVLEHLDKGSKYLNKRYGDQPMWEERNFMENSNPKTDVFYATGVMARKNSVFANKIFDDCWHRQLEYSCFDQGWLNFFIGKYDAHVAPIPYKNDHFIVGNHAQGFDNE